MKVTYVSGARRQEYIRDQATITHQGDVAATVERWLNKRCIIESVTHDEQLVRFLAYEGVEVEVLRYE